MNTSLKANCECLYPTIAVANLVQTVEFYRDQLGFDVQFMWGEPPVHAGLEFGKAVLHLNEQTGANPRATSEGCWIYFQVQDVDTLYDRFSKAEVDIVEPPTSREWGMREISINDNNGFRLRFGQVDHASGEPVVVERRVVNAKIETRLADLLNDLAVHKKMSLGEVLEETLLHTFEAVTGMEGQGVASPHTQHTMQHIEELKQKHGIDYETHDAYRFQEE